MAATITFRPRPAVRAALDARCANGGPDRTAVINSALAEYLGVSIDDATSGVPGDPGQPEAGRGTAAPRRPRGRARQAVPTVGEPPECPHPKASIKKLPYGNQCTECGQMVKP